MNEAKVLADQIISTLKKEAKYELLPGIIEVLREESYRSQEIHLLSAVKLESDQLKELKTILEQKWGEHPIVEAVDPALLSGLVVKFQDQVLDLSGKYQLEDLKQKLI
jgi:F0F1-type ATP synthase delta subunit